MDARRDAAAVSVSELDSEDERRAWGFFQSAQDGFDSFSLSISTLIDETSDRIVDILLPDDSDSGRSSSDNNNDDDDDKTHGPPRSYEARGVGFFDNAASDSDEDATQYTQQGGKSRYPPSSLGDADGALRSLLGRNVVGLKERGEKLSRLEQTAQSVGDRSREIRDNSTRLRALAEQERLDKAAGSGGGGGGGSCCALF